MFSGLSSQQQVWHGEERKIYREARTVMLESHLYLLFGSKLPPLWKGWKDSFPSISPWTCGTQWEPFKDARRESLGPNTPTTELRKRPEHTRPDCSVQTWLGQEARAPGGTPGRRGLQKQPEPPRTLWYRSAVLQREHLPSFPFQIIKV